jgi:hypothetical protein
VKLKFINFNRKIETNEILDDFEAGDCGFETGKLNKQYINPKSIV